MVLDGELGWVCLMCCNADSKSALTNYLGRLTEDKTPKPTIYKPTIPCSYHPPFYRPETRVAVSAKPANISRPVLFSALVIQWLTARDNTGTTISNSTILPSSSTSASDKPPGLSSTPSSRPHRRRRSGRPTISLPMNATSTSQYEHIFGGDDDDGPGPEPEEQLDQTDVASTSASNSDTAAAAAAAKAPAAAAKSPAAGTGNNNTLSYFSFDDSDLTPATNDDGEIDIGAGAMVTSTTTAGRRKSNSTPPTATTNTTASTDALPRVGRARHRESTGAPVSATSSSAAAVAADLERLRLYRQRRPTPSRAAARAAAAVAAEAERSAYPYRISHLAFEGDRGSRGGGELEWYEFDGALDGDEDDVGEGESQGPAGWI